MSLAWWGKLLHPRDATPVHGGWHSHLGWCRREAVMCVLVESPGLGFGQGLELLCRTLHMQAQWVGSHPDPCAVLWWKGVQDGTWAVALQQMAVL